MGKRARRARVGQRSPLLQMATAARGEMDVMASAARRLARHYLHAGKAGAGEQQSFVVIVTPEGAVSIAPLAGDALAALSEQCDVPLPSFVHQFPGKVTDPEEVTG